MEEQKQSHRSWNMSRIRGKNTSPEVSVRKKLSQLGYRYRLHYSKLPGKPDIVFVSKKLAANINGCFWHQHKDCKNAVIPKTNRDFWVNKLNATKERDSKNYSEITEAGWKVLTLWECDIEKDLDGSVNHIVADLR